MTLLALPCGRYWLKSDTACSHSFGRRDCLAVRRRRCWLRLRRRHRSTALRIHCVLVFCRSALSWRHANRIADPRLASDIAGAAGIAAGCCPVVGAVGILPFAISRSSGVTQTPSPSLASRQTKPFLHPASAVPTMASQSTALVVATTFADSAFRPPAAHSLVFNPATGKGKDRH